MKVHEDKFKVLLCVKKEVADLVRPALVHGADLHVQFTSSPRFLMSRAIFAEPQLAVIDSSFEKTLLLDMLATFHLQFSNVTVYVVSSSANHRQAAEAMSLGASGYFGLPGDAKQLSDKVEGLLELWRSGNAQQRFLELQRKAYNFDQIIGTSVTLQQVLERAKKVIDNSRLTVLITGETGTGKELLARAIHYNGKTNSSPFVDIGCSALPENLLESELFGYEKGAFTDAREKKVGLFELAQDGTIFLDEIADISLAMQSKLLKVIESRTMRRLGGLKDIPVKARIIAATSGDLTAKMKSGQFRKDLYHRLKIIPLEIPPLRERREDIPLLIDSFLHTFNPLYNKRVCGIAPEALEILQSQHWDGNVRELKHTIERAVLLEETEILRGRDFGFLEPADGAERGDQPKSHRPNDVFVLSIPLEMADLEDVQREFALKVLDRVGGNKSKAAYIMRISRPRLDRILKAEHAA
ncbi:MAG TPA: sigma-54 dependent transcriptional regulator [Bacteroidota bacterium]|nr:sigma-54 dependent transcriptional regulator [Bacteroidota bacterium]